MRPPPTITGAILGLSWFQDPLRRRLTFLLLVLILLVLSVWPRHYVARTQLLPDDSGSTLSSLLGQAGGGAGGLLSLGSLLGNHQSIESDLTISTSEVVREDVVRRLRAEGLVRPGDMARVEAKLRHTAQLDAVRGSILRIVVTDSDPVFAKAVATAYIGAIRQRVGEISIEQAAQKKVVAEGRLSAATADLAQAQQALDQFRAANKLASPEIQLGAAVSLVTQLQANLHAAQAHLETLQRFATNSNVEVEAAQAQVAALQGQIADAQANERGAGVPSVGAMSPRITEYQNLYRTERFAEAEYEIYDRYLGTVTVEELAAGINMDLIEPPYVDPDRQYNSGALGALILVILLAVFSEYYIFRTTPGHR